ncbi:MAG: DNA gyrase inhibitor YacG [Sphingobium sp.]
MPRKDGCPLCGKPIDPPFKPFCSRGCRDRDLLAWFGEEYRTPARPTGDDEEDSLPIASGDED